MKYFIIAVYSIMFTLVILALVFAMKTGDKMCQLEKERNQYKDTVQLQRVELRMCRDSMKKSKSFQYTADKSYLGNTNH